MIPKQKGRRPKAAGPLFSLPIWNLGYICCGISTGSPNSPIWNLGYNFLGISTSSPNSLFWRLGCNVCGIELFSLYPPVSALPIMVLGALSSWQYRNYFQHVFSWTGLKALNAGCRAQLQIIKYELVIPNGDPVLAIGKSCFIWLFHGPVHLHCGFFIWVFCGPGRRNDSYIVSPLRAVGRPSQGTTFRRTWQWHFIEAYFSNM